MSLQCLISALTQVGGGGLLFRFVCSFMLWGRRGTENKYHWHVWGVLAVFWPHWVCPPLTASVLSPAILPRLQAALQGVGPELYALPRSKPLRFRFLGTPRRHRLGFACVLCLPCLSSLGNQELEERTLPRCSVPYTLPIPASVSRCGGPCVSSGELISGCDSLGRCQPSRISASLWLEIRNLFAV